MENLIGKKLDGRYGITELIGMGGMANVYKAVDLLENKTVAVKVLRDEFLDNEELVRRFKNESKAIGLLSHPNIVRVFDVNFSEAVQYIVMEFIDGITLKQYIDVQKPLSWRDTVHFTTQILRALQHAHDRGIVHRDIKPQNIMLLPDGSIKVMDFGIARFSRSETRTITDKAIGSVHYISPEQAKGDITDAKADIYSVGIMMYEMLTGTLPFESDTPVQVAIKQISDDARRPREIVEDIPEGLEEITLKAMAKDPAKRYQSASQMLRDIDDFKKNPSIVFEYKYFTEHRPAGSYTAERPAATGEHAEKKSAAERAPAAKAASAQKGKKRKGNITMYTILGVTAAIVLCTSLLVVYLFGGFDKTYGTVQIPNFVNMKYEDIVNDPQYKFKFKQAEDSDYNEAYPIGHVYRQFPVPPKQVKENSVVTLYVSKGIEVFEMPDVLDMTGGEAKKLLNNRGLQVKQELVNDPNYGSNIVVSQEPPAGNEVRAGDVVIIRINLLAVTSESIVPNVVGMSYSDAQTELNKAGLWKGNVTETPSDLAPGTVISQTPGESTRVTMGTKVDLVISSGPAEKKYDIKVNIPAPDGVTYTAKIVVGGSVVHTQTLTGPQNNWGTKITVTSTTEVQVLINNQVLATFRAYVDQDKLEALTTGTIDWAAAAIHTVTISVGAGGHANVASVSGSPGETRTFTLTFDAGYTFGGASGAGATWDGASTLTVIIGSANETVTVTVTPPAPAPGP